MQKNDVKNAIDCKVKKVFGWLQEKYDRPIDKLDYIVTGILLVICIFGSLRLPAVIAGKLQKKMHTVPRIILNVLFYGIVFMACVSLIVGDSYNPFLYFRF